MIKIEITDVEKLDPSVLRATGRYLLDLSRADDEQIEASPLHKHVEKIMSSVNIPELNEEARTARETAEDIGRSLAMAHLKEAVVNFKYIETENDIIPEEYIPVPAETVVAPCPAQIFAAPVPVPAVAQPGVELDTEGLPWDMRIHARTKTKMKDGSWKKLRGIGPDVVKSVEAELKAVQSLPAAVVPPAPVAVPEIPPPPVALGFMDLMTLVTGAITDGSLKRDQVLEVLGRWGIPSLPVIASRPDLIPEVITALQGVINASQ